MVERIVPSDLSPDELFRRNGEYVAAHDFDEILSALIQCVDVMGRSIYPKPDVADDHPWSVLERARALIEKAKT